MTTDLYADLIGKPYSMVGGGNCWNLCHEVLTRQGYKSKRKLYNPTDDDKPDWVELANPVDGCVVAISQTQGRWIDHAGIFIAPNRILHARHQSGVVIEKINRWKPYIVGYYLPKERINE